MDKERWAVIDIDGVLNNYPKCWLEFIKIKTGREFNDLQEAKSKLSYYEYKKLKLDYRTSGFKKIIEPSKGAKELALWLKNNGFKVVIITARDQELSYYDTVEWLKNNGIYYNRLVFDTKKHVKVFEDFSNASMIIEDNTSIANKFSKFGFKVFLITCKENKKYTIDKSVHVCDNLEELLLCLKKYW